MNNEIIPIKLEDLIDFKNGKIAPKESGAIPVYGGNGILGYTNVSNYENVLIIGRVGAYCGSVHFEKGKCWVSDNAIAGVHKQIESNEYNYYLLKCISLNKRQIGSSQPLLTQGILNQIDVNVYSDVKARKKIASVLSALDSKIEINNRINADLEAMVKTLYNYWFVQFDFPNKNSKPYKTSGGKMVWNEELQKEIPVGWEDGTLGDIAELVRGVTYDSSEIKSPNDNGVIPILRATNISGNVIDLNDMVYVPKQNVSPTQVLNKFDILITMSSGSKEHIGKNGFFFYEKEASFGAFCAKIVAKSNYRFYLYSYTQSDFMFTTIKNECLGTNINNLNGSLVKGFRIVLPPTELIESFNEKVSTIYEKIGKNLIENQKLTELRDWLLPMLMNGQVKVN
ncbi:restriction endonuclease subunit S [Flavihumibacter rivuli]|uniref:restriction endonuclease subunit S n=1 Tax=Flavihumibacter rivuli TaxID=2838156 RepID=UPI001BDF31F7|nr:restriction endonuclease subunit S [Flavihumibacter rivuli]ULQ58329.1 restriction endonuclease subunit S [Flavihumibacter rivuli]